MTANISICVKALQSGERTRPGCSRTRPRVRQSGPRFSARARKTAPGAGALPQVGTARCAVPVAERSVRRRNGTTDDGRFTTFRPLGAPACSRLLTSKPAVRLTSQEPWPHKRGVVNRSQTGAPGAVRPGCNRTRPRVQCRHRCRKCAVRIADRPVHPRP